MKIKNARIAGKVCPGCSAQFQVGEEVTPVAYDLERYYVLRAKGAQLAPGAKVIYHTACLPEGS